MKCIEINRTNNDSFILLVEKRMNTIVALSNEQQYLLVEGELNET
jgi:hypothetical protein